MEKKSLIGSSIFAVAFLVLGSLSNVVGYQTVKSNVISESFVQTQIEPGYVNWTVNGTMGKNDWYISPVTLTCTYDHDVYAHVYYGYENYSGEYTEPITIENQGYISFSFSAVDYEGNVEKVGQYWFQIDYSIPEIFDLSVEKIGFTKWLFSALVEDDFSGVVNVEFYLDEQFLTNVPAPGPYEYNWIGSGNHTVRVIVYDFAGLNASSSMNTPSEVQSTHQQTIKERISHLGKVSSSGMVSFLYLVIAFLTYLFLFLTQGSHMQQRELILYSLLWPFLYLLIWILLFIS